jgi:hypothetical protein
MGTKTIKMTAMAVAVAAGLSGSAAAEVIEKTTFKGSFAFALFSQETPITCADGSASVLNTTVGITANEFVSRSRQFPDVATNTLFLTGSRFDSCTGTGVFGQASVDNAFSQNDLQSATMVATVTLVDFDGNPAGTLAVNVTLEGTGTTIFSQTHNRSEFEGPDGPIVIITRARGTSRNATASGSVVFDGVELIGSFLFGSVQESRSGSTELQK